MRPILGTVILFLVIFLILVMIGMNTVPQQPVAHAMEFAIQWTVRLFGAIAAVASAIALLLVAAAKGPMERQITLVLPLLAGLLMLSTTWSLGISVGTVAAVWLWRRPASSEVG